MTTFINIWVVFSQNIKTGVILSPKSVDHLSKSQHFKTCISKYQSQILIIKSENITNRIPLKYKICSTQNLGGLKQMASKTFGPPIISQLKKGVQVKKHLEYQF